MRVVTWVATPDWSLSADTDDPGVGNPVLLAPVVASWATESIPPVAQPEIVTVQIYDAGPPPFGTWAPMELGTPIGVYVYTDRPGGGSDTPVTFQGRISDVSAVPHPEGGLVFTLVCAGRIADWNSTNAPNLIAGDYGDPAIGGGAWLTYFYATVAADADLPLNPDDGHLGPDAAETLLDGNAMENLNTSSGDVLGRIAMQDVRTASGFDVYVTHYLAYDIDPASVTPLVDPADFRVVPYNPAILDLAGVLTLFNDTAGSGYWIAVTNPDYYTDGGVGMVLDASQVLLEIGAWTTSRLTTINTVELTGSFLPGPIETIRVQHADLVASSGRQTRTVDTPDAAQVTAIEIGRNVLGPRSQVDTGFGLTQAVVMMDLLDDYQLAAWGSLLWPTADNAIGGGPIGRPIAITNIPDDWRLAPGPIVFGRLVGVQATVGVSRKSVDNVAPSAGRVELALTLRAMPALTDAGITWDDMGNFVGADPDWIDLDPTLTWQTFSLIGP